MSREKASLLVELEERLHFEALIADLSSRFVHVPAGQVDREINHAQRTICERLALDFSALWQWSSDPAGSFTLTHFYSVAEGPQPAGGMHQDQYPWARGQLLAGRVISVASLDELPPEAARDRDTLREFGIKSNLALPLSVGGEPPLGLLGFGTTRAERRWPEPLVKRLQVLAEIFAGALARKRADQALRESEERLSLAAESAEAGLWVLDCRTGVFWATGKARKTFGYAPDEVINLHSLETSVHPEDWPLVRESLDRSVRAGEPLNVEYRIRLEAGRTRWIASRGRPHFTPDAQAERLMGVSIDITDRKVAETAFRASEARLAAGADLAGLGYYEVDFDEPYCYVDARFHQICGLPMGRHPNLRPLELWMGQVHPDDRPRVMEAREKLHSGQLDRLSVQYRYLHPTRGQRWVHHLARVARRSPAGRTVRSYGVLRDVTDTRALSDRLQAAAQEWQATFDSINDLVMILDPAGRFTRVNAATARFLGRPAEHLVGGSCCALMHGASCRIEGCPCQVTLQTQQRSEFDRWHAASSRWLQFSTDPICDAAGRVSGAVHIGKDITAVKRAEAELLRQGSELAHVARVSTLGELAASVAHELNQPLGAILANAEAAELFLEQDPPALGELREILAAIRKDDERAGEVIRRMRTLLRKRGLERQAMDLNVLVEDVLRFVRTDAALRGVTLATDLHPALPAVAGDRIHLQQVLLNLLLNGLEAVTGQPQERRHLSVSTRPGAAGGVELAVMDAGPGLPPDQLPRLFEPFYTTKPDGMGMGLSIARTIVEAHHGRIWAENRPTGGASFRLTLPASGVPETALGREPRASDSTSGSSSG